MKKLDKSISENYLPIKLYLDDLETIEEILKEVSNSISFEAENYKFDSIEELKGNLKLTQINELEVKTSSPYISIDFTRIWARVYVSSSETSNAGVFYKLDQIISRRTRKPRWKYSFYFFNITTIILLMNGMPLIQRLFSRSLNPYVSLTISAIWFIWMIWFFYVRFRQHTVIVLAHRNSEKPFLQRNKDNLILAIISALLGAILGVAGTLITSHFQNK